MTSSRREAPGDARGLPLDDVIEIQGDVLPIDQDGVLATDELEHEREPTRTELDHGYPARDPVMDHDEADTLDGLDLDDLREGETDDPQAATEEGLAYVPPIDPPAVAAPGSPDGIEMAVGLSEPDLDARIREALRADAQTNGLADRLVVGTRGSVAVIRGVIDDVNDSDSIIEVVSSVRGITDVVDETELAS